MISKASFISIIFILTLGSLLVISCSDDDREASINNEDPPLAQPFLGELEYVKTFGGSDSDDFVSIVQTLDGNYVLAGSTKSTDGDITGKTGDDTDFWLTKMTPDGEIIFNKVYGGTNTDKATNMIKTNDGGFIISGYSLSSDGDVSGNEGFQDFWITKLDSNGNLTWEKNYGFSGGDQALKVIETTDGKYFATGFLDVTASNNQGNDGEIRTANNSSLTRNNRHGVGEFWGILMESDGTKIWRRYFGGSNNDRSYDVIETQTGGFLMIGTSESTDFDIIDDKGSYDFWIVNVSREGDKVWTKSFGGSGIDQGYSIIRAEDGNYIIVGDTRSSDGDVSSLIGNADAWVVKFDPNGNLIWEKTYGGLQFDSAKHITRMQNGDYAITGNTRSSFDGLTNRGQNDAWVFIIDANGNQKFNYTVGGSNLDFSEGVLQTLDNKILFVGSTESNDADITENKGGKDALLIKIK